MSHDGLIQWTEAVVRQTERLVTSRARLSECCSLSPTNLSSEARTQMFADIQEARRALQTECHFFAIAASKLLEHRQWAVGFGLCANVEFSEIDQFSSQDIKDLRDMREHVVGYFKGEGWAPDRWRTPDGTSDASSLNGTLIGGRLDWVAFGTAAKRLLLSLLSEPVPFAPTPS
jgi:hypothetical protein